MSDYATEFDDFAAALAGLGVAFRSIEDSAADKVTPVSLWGETAFLNRDRPGPDAEAKTKAEEDAELLRGYRSALERIATAVEWRGPDDLTGAIPLSVERIVAALRKAQFENMKLRESAGKP